MLGKGHIPAIASTKKFISNCRGNPSWLSNPQNVLTVILDTQPGGATEINQVDGRGRVITGGGRASKMKGNSSRSWALTAGWK